MRLYIMRHGDAESSSKTGKDFDRNLTEKGREQARNINHFLQVIAKDVAFTVYCSGAKRTKETWKTISEGITVETLHFKDEIYHANKEDVYRILRGVDPSTEHLLLIGHNNAISYFVSDLVGEDLIFPTGGLVEIAFPIIEEWKYVGKDTGVIGNRSF